MTKAKRNTAEATEGQTTRRRLTVKLPLALEAYISALGAGLVAMATTWRFPVVNLKEQSRYISFYASEEEARLIDRLHSITGKTRREIIVAGILRARDSVTNPLFDEMASVKPADLYVPTAKRPAGEQADRSHGQPAGRPAGVHSSRLNG